MSFSGKKKKALLKADKEKRKERRKKVNDLDNFEREQRYQEFAACTRGNVGYLNKDERVVDVCNVHMDNHGRSLKTVLPGDGSKELDNRISKAKQPLINIPSGQLGFPLFDPESMCSGNVIDIPRRPPWSDDMTSSELDNSEGAYFSQYVANLYDTYGADKLNKFELNLETWRQLWRTVERSDVMLVLCDIRLAGYSWPESLHRCERRTNTFLIDAAHIAVPLTCMSTSPLLAPSLLLYIILLYCAVCVYLSVHIGDLLWPFLVSPSRGWAYRYLTDAGKPYALVLTKTDLVPVALAQAWADYFRERLAGIPVVLFSQYVTGDTAADCAGGGEAPVLQCGRSARPVLAPARRPVRRMQLPRPRGEADLLAAVRSLLRDSLRANGLSGDAVEDACPERGGVTCVAEVPPQSLPWVSFEPSHVNESRARQMAGESEEEEIRGACGGREQAGQARSDDCSWHGDMECGGAIEGPAYVVGTVQPTRLSVGRPRHRSMIAPERRNQRNAFVTIGGFCVR